MSTRAALLTLNLDEAPWRHGLAGQAGQPTMQQPLDFDPLHRVVDDSSDAQPQLAQWCGASSIHMGPAHFAGPSGYVAPQLHAIGLYTGHWHGVIRS